jgi:hypothetical protein
MGDRMGARRDFDAKRLLRRVAAAVLRLATSRRGEAADLAVLRPDFLPGGRPRLLPAAGRARRDDTERVERAVECLFFVSTFMSKMLSSELIVSFTCLPPDSM